MLGAFTFGQYLDSPLCVRSKKAKLGLMFIGFFFTATWAGCLLMEMNNASNTAVTSLRIDILDDTYSASLVLILLSGFSDATIQSWCYWMMGTTTNNAMILSRHAGFYKAIQSAGTAVAWYASLLDIASTTWVIVVWMLLYVVLGFAYFATNSVTDTNYHLGAHRQFNDSPTNMFYPSQIA
ncbi:hypothetical protein K7432_016491 [Basidiobolus ranarum]|uniref:Uncharacterized protein n=1 Tax=Basidiobolus ranarum TaxID=34480 RepID=A0ABR2VLI3_9FUNG